MSFHPCPRALPFAPPSNIDPRPRLLCCTPGCGASLLTAPPAFRHAATRRLACYSVLLPDLHATLAHTDVASLPPCTAGTPW